jgi:NADPH:quinone reductase-like Zn-dependent oxidoreductase
MEAESFRAFQISGPGRGEIVPVPSAPCGAHEVRVRTRFSGISRGTERLVHQGRVPPGEYGRMRAPFQRGEFPGPVVYGYSNVGRVEQGPVEWVGRDVFCLYPHQTGYVVPSTAVVPLPDGLPPERAVLAANMETAVNVLWDVAPRVGDRISVVGGGTLGCLVAALCTRLPGADVELIDVVAEREDIARQLGAGFRHPQAAAGERDLVVHASATETGLRRALTLAGDEATVVEVSWYGEGEVCLPLGEAFHSRRLSLRSSQVGRITPDRVPRWTHRRRLELALDLLRDPVFDRLIDAESPFEEMPATMAAIAAGGGGSFCHRVRYDGP